MRYLKHNNTFFLREHSLTSRECYDYYKEHRRWNSPTINQYNYFVKALEGFFLVVQRMMTQSKGGVYMTGLGYFACVLDGKKKVNSKLKKVKSLVVKVKPRNRYKLYFFPNKDLEKWTMEDTFLPRFNTKFQLTKGEHKLHFDICKAHEIAEAYATKLHQHRTHKGEFNFDPNDI